MVKIDMHVHSEYSGRPSSWFLQKFGTNESYTKIETIYQTAKDRGMDYVVVTDHNKIEGAVLLKANHPDDVIIGCEFTTYFPEDGCKAHVLVYDITDQQFNEMNILRENIYELRNYIIKNDIAYSLAHATYSINNKLKVEHLEKFILLFDVFEGINGSRNELGNIGWMNILKNLNQGIIIELHDKYKITPASDTPWIKGFTGGSDDHGALFIGRTYTEAKADDITDFITQLKNKKTNASGRHNDYISFAFALYKVLFDFSKNKQQKQQKSFFSEVLGLLYEKKDFSLINWLKINSIKKNKKKEVKENFKIHLNELIEELKSNKELSIEKRFELVFNKISDVFDDYLTIIIRSIHRNINRGDLVDIIKNASSFIPSFFLTLPFFTSLIHMHQVRPIINEMQNKYLSSFSYKKKRILWFTDTINALNGVSVTLNKMGWYCYETNRDLYIISSLDEKELSDELTPNFINIPYIYEFELPNYEHIKLKIPSILKVIQMLYNYQPDEIYISTPGPVGLLGLLYSKLLNIPTTGIYHTDFTEQAYNIIGKDSVVDFIEISTKWFFEVMDRIKVPTKEYISILENRSFNHEKMDVFKRGIDDDFINIKKQFTESLKRDKKKTTLIYAGRISQDKNVDLLIDICKELNKKYSVRLIIAGDGPYYKELRKRSKHDKQIILTGYVKRKELISLYLKSDIFVFPSTTDTFGMVVLEAQACGLPAIVSDIGGPKEIIINKKTGLITKHDNLKDWINNISFYIDFKNNNHSQFLENKKIIRDHILNIYQWENVMQDIFEESYSVKKENKLIRKRVIKKNKKTIKDKNNLLKN